MTTDQDAATVRSVLTNFAHDEMASMDEDAQVAMSGMDKAELAFDALDRLTARLAESEAGWEEERRRFLEALRRHRALTARIAELEQNHIEAERWWAEYVLDLQAENQRLREALEQIAEGVYEGTGLTSDEMRFAARAALTLTEDQECYCAARAGEGHKIADHAGEEPTDE